ncbi:Cell surface superoxide dismutase [Cu-Zn] 4 [Cladophialophora chaetospira]|uniref:superoxide dismutase n=1 Tax=Cladophialophora chaetospira TaxID=386627 RepID=A0AA38X6R5_9EURO|nr:Cell surface superoxide dismutase [Cu-Zn] 4 [Cladophialophora chaetospira]
MTALAFLALLFPLTISVLAQETSNSTNAPITENNPIRVTFQATLQSNKPVQGQITGVSNDNGTGVNFNVNFFSFPDAALGPFLYHIHQYPIDTSGNCTSAGGHLSPFGRAETPPCDPTQPDTCQPGDLSGKHGNISLAGEASAPDGSGGSNAIAAAAFQTTYLDLYVSTDPKNVAYFGNRSVVIHAANGTRLNCANFTQQMPTETFGGPGSNNTTATASSSPTGAAVSSLEVAKMQVFLCLGALTLAIAVGFF